MVYCSPKIPVLRENVGNADPSGCEASAAVALGIGLNPYQLTNLAMAKAVALFGWAVTVIIPGTLAESATAKS